MPNSGRPELGCGERRGRRAGRLSGRVDVNFGSAENLLPLVLEGKLRALVVTSEMRNHNLPNVPTMIEVGFPRLTRGFWAGLLAPAGTPADIVKRLNSEINASLATSEMKKRLIRDDFTAYYPGQQPPRRATTYRGDDE